LTKIKTLSSSKKAHIIDAVITWVDGSEEQHQKKMLPYLKNTEELITRKFKSRFHQVNEIKFTIDSILKYAPFIRNIYIITDNQVPIFLTDKDTKKKYKNIFIIDHTVIFSGHEEFLPTFNSRSIETFMFRIPNLAEHFIYLNDDFFLINETVPTDFFKNGLPVLRGKWKKLDKDVLYKQFKKPRLGHKAAQQKSAKLAGFPNYYNFKHTPHPFRKSTFKACFKENEPLFLNNIKHKFRSSDQFLIQGMINHIEITNGTCIFQNDSQLLYFRSYKKPLFWYKFKLNATSKRKLFLGLQNLNLCPPIILKYIIKWLENRTK